MTLTRHIHPFCVHMFRFVQFARLFAVSMGDVSLYAFSDNVDTEYQSVMVQILLLVVRCTCRRV